MTTLKKWRAFSTDAQAQVKRAHIPKHGTSFIQFNYEPSFESYFNIVVKWRGDEAYWHKRTWDIWTDHEHYFERDLVPKALVIDKSPTIHFDAGYFPVSDLEVLTKMISELDIRPVIDPLRMFTLDGALYTIMFGVDYVRTTFSWHTLPDGWSSLEKLADYLVEKCKYENPDDAVMIKGKLFTEMQSLCKYFEHHSKNNTWFVPEFEVSSAVNNYIESLQTLAIDEARRIAQLFNSINGKKHYNGSGWQDYKMHLSGLLENNGYDTKWTEAGLEVE